MKTTDADTNGQQTRSGIPTYSVLFVHSDVDDYGLTPSQFRVLARIARRGTCTESVPNIAKGCGLHEDTARRALKFLVDQRIVSKERRAGYADVYLIQPLKIWKQHPTVNNGGVSVTGEGGEEAGGDHPTANNGDEGNPLEGNPTKEHINKGVAFVEPSLEAVITYGKTIERNEEDCKNFYHNHSPKRWSDFIGKHPDLWKSKLATWFNNANKTGARNSGQSNRSIPSLQIQIKACEDEIARLRNQTHIVEGSSFARLKPEAAEEIKQLTEKVRGLKKRIIEAP